MAALRLCGDIARGYALAFSVRFNRGKYMGRALLGCQRIHLGAYEAAILADANFRYNTESLLHGLSVLLVRKAARHAHRAQLDPRALLHLQRSNMQISRPREHLDLLHQRGDSLRIRGEATKTRRQKVRFPGACLCLSHLHRPALHHLHFQDATPRDISRSRNENLRHPIARNTTWKASFQKEKPMHSHKLEHRFLYYFANYKLHFMDFMSLLLK